MTLRFKPNQSFVVKKTEGISILQVKIISQVYQPLIGSCGLAIYFTLANLPLADLNYSQRFVHSELCQRMDVGINEVNEAIIRCEAMGLIKTYRLVDSHSQADLQTILYQLEAPLSFKDFIEHPQYGTALYNQIGSDNFDNLLSEWQTDTDELKSQEITTPFGEVYSYHRKSDQQNILSKSKSHSFRQDTSEPQKIKMPETFNYSDFIRYMIREKIDHSQLTQSLKEQVIGLHEIYGFSEVEMVQVLKRAQNTQTGRIQTERLNEIASKYAHYKDEGRGQSHKTSSVETKEENMDDINNPRQGQSFPYQYNDHTRQLRLEELEQKYPDLSEVDYQVILQCEQMDSSNYLEKIKEAQGQGGFVTSSEEYYVKDITNKTRLSGDVINFLVYYLILILKRDNIYKGDLERHASKWQSEGIEEVGDAMRYIRRRQEENNERKNQPQNKKYYNKKQQEVIPQWMKDQEAKEKGQAVETKRNENRQLTDPDVLRQQLKDLFKKED